MLIKTQYTHIRDIDVLRLALKLSSGEYQRDIILGYHSITGSTLSKKQRENAAKMERSRESLAQKLGDAGIVLDIDESGQYPIFMIEAPRIVYRSFCLYLGANCSLKDYPQEQPKPLKWYYHPVSYKGEKTWSFPHNSKTEAMLVIDQHYGPLNTVNYAE